jgi:Arm DNA-binding domain
MPHKSLTQLMAERLRPKAAEVMFWDTNLPGFGLRVSPKGRKSFIVQYRVRGAKGTAWKERQIVLGTLAFLTVAQASDRARQYKTKASEGIDPVEETKRGKENRGNETTGQCLYVPEAGGSLRERVSGRA